MRQNVDSILNIAATASNRLLHDLAIPRPLTAKEMDAPQFRAAALRYDDCHW